MWLQEDEELSQQLSVLANSSKIQLNQDSEPFLPMPTNDDDQEEEVEIPNLVDEEAKQRAIERLYHYYNYLILE